MGEEKPTYEELETLLLEAERALKAIRDGEIDTVISEKGVYYLRLKELEKELTRSQKQIAEMDLTLNTLMECVPEGITIAGSPDVNVIRVSKHGKDLLGKSGQILEGILVDQHVTNWDIYESDGETRAKNEDLPLTRAVRKGEMVKEEEWVLGAADGTRIPILCNATPIINHQGKILGGIIAWRDIRRQKENEKALRILNETLKQKVQERTAELERQIEERKILSQNLVKLLERDRSDMAMALHDQAGQLLTAIGLDLELLKGEPLSKSITEIMRSIEDKTAELHEFLRNISRQLRPASLDKTGLVPVLKAVIDDMAKNTGIKIRFFTSMATERLHPDKELALYRLGQEALTNIQKHARANEVSVTLIKKDDTLVLTVEDNGIGFDYGEMSRSFYSQDGPLGLTIMQERALQAGGKLWVDTRVGGGTVITAEIPLGDALKEVQGAGTG